MEPVGTTNAIGDFFTTILTKINDNPLGTNIIGGVIVPAVGSPVGLFLKNIVSKKRKK